jgi:two-component system cell cycle response regulator CtrA
MHTVIHIGQLVINLNRRIVEVNSRPLPLTAMEYAILEFLSLHEGETVTREMLIGHLYGMADNNKAGSLRVLISNLRRKVAQATGNDDYIRTMERGGYALRDALE